MTLARRIAAALILLAAGAVLAPGACFYRQLEQRLEELEDREAAELHAALDRRLADLQAGLERGVARAAAELAADGPFLAAALSPPAARVPAADRAVRERGPALLAASDLDALWIVGGDGEVIACGHWPARAGGSRSDLARAPAGRAWLSRERVRNEDWPALLLSEPVPTGGTPLRLVGGMRLDEAVRHRLGAGASLALALFDAEGDLLAAHPWPFPMDRLPEEMRAAAREGEGRLERRGSFAGGTGLLVAGRTLLADGEVGGVLVAVRSLEALAAWRRQVLLTLSLLGLGAVGIAGVSGLWLGRRLAAPVRELTAGTQRMATGELDEDLPVRSRDEVGRLTESFNAMAAAIRRSQRELAESERLAAWRDAARRMAHEVKNPLAPIRMSVENLRRARERSPERFAALFDEECRTILEEVDALRRLVDEFSRFARLPEPRPRPTLPSDLIRHAADLYAASLDGVDLEVEAGPDLAPAPLDPELMGQVLKNLLSNALEAVPRPGGRIRLAAARRGEELVLSVADNGPGIPPEIRARLFEPQITTKRAGSGLGLAVSRQIVERHGGRMEVETSPTGTAFHVILPVAAPPGKAGLGAGPDA